jgi:small GTP-binding protein
MADTSSGEIPKYRLLVCGRTHTGKTSIIRQYIDRAFTAAYLPTPLSFGDYAKFEDEVGSYELQIWDTAGAEEWMSSNTLLYHSTQIIFFVASCDEPTSLKDIVEKWIPQVKQHVQLEDCIVVLALNKCDLIRGDPGANQLSQEEIQQTKDILQATFFEVSAKEDQNIRELFHWAAGAARKRWPPEFAPSAIAEVPASRCCH